LTPQFGSNAGDERYVGQLKSAEFASVATDAGTGGLLHYRIVTEGVPVFNRSGGGPNCTAADSRGPVEERLREVLGFFGYADGATLCENPAGATGLVDHGEPAPQFRTSLEAFTPNPFHAGQAGKILFTVERDGPSKMDVFDVQGRLVRSIFAGQARRGVNETSWEGTDGTGRPVASGVYLVRLEADGKSLARTIVIVRDPGD
jgi:hypothetical protein